MLKENEDLQLEVSARVRVLSEALPYMQQFAGRTVVVKYGGAAMKDSTLKDKVMRDIVFLSCVGVRPVLVHGGGPEINTWLGKLGIEPQFKNGLRVTDADTMEVVEMVLVGRVNKEIVSLINTAGGKAIGLCGKDGNLICARMLCEHAARSQGDEGIGFVGEVSSVDTEILQSLVNSGYIPVVSSVAADETGQAYNINADTVAGELAAALGAEKLILLTDTAGILQDYKDPSTLIYKLDIQQARSLIEKGVVAGGMIPKVNCCVRSLAQGVRAAHIIDGRMPHALLLEIFTDSGIGSMIVASEFMS
ncbi:MAG: acetylglutamate kinase [Hormoscilla sp. GUM202]|nr:acetylglutamate kinase [Hormoscilla sp. GUM202]